MPTFKFEHKISGGNPNVCLLRENLVAIVFIVLLLSKRVYVTIGCVDNVLLFFCHCLIKQRFKGRVFMAIVIFVEAIVICITFEKE